MVELRIVGKIQYLKLRTWNSRCFVLVVFGRVIGFDKEGDEIADVVTRRVFGEFVGWTRIHSRHFV